MKLVPRYTNIGDGFAISDHPAKVAAPQLLLWNEPLAKQFNIHNVQSNSSPPPANTMSCLPNWISSIAWPIQCADVAHAELIE